MIRRAGPEDMADVLEIRRVVFIVGQNVPEHEERDGKDDEAIHLIAFHDGRPIGTARLLVDGDHAKILREAGLIESRQVGRQARHEIDSNAVRRLFRDLERFLDLPELE